MGVKSFNRHVGKIAQLVTLTCSCCHSKRKPIDMVKEFG